MAGELKVDGRMTVKSLKSKFKEEFGLEIRIYDGKKLAEEGTLASLKKEGKEGGEISMNLRQLVSTLETQFADKYGIRINVVANDGSLADNKKSLAEITREKAKTKVKK